MTYNSPLWAFEGEVITEVANIKEEGLASPEWGEGDKGILKINLSLRELNLGHLRERQECWPLH